MKSDEYEVTGRNMKIINRQSADTFFDVIVWALLRTIVLIIITSNWLNINIGLVKLPVIDLEHYFGNKFNQQINYRDYKIS